LGERDFHDRSARQQRIKFTGLIQGGKIVGTSDMAVIYEYLWNGHPATRPLDHLLTILATHADVSFFETNILVFKQGFGPEAIAAGKLCINFNFRHISLFLPSPCKWANSERNSSNR
tara:strand:- start:8182 stop:8532 length:351 start_codon:yes stop_codon:yes gene_type:complete